jgi:hypothetical protein
VVAAGTLTASNSAAPLFRTLFTARLTGSASATGQPKVVFLDKSYNTSGNSYAIVSHCYHKLWGRWTPTASSLSIPASGPLSA